jgi:hypothetical protein
LSYLTSPLAEHLVITGPGYARLFMSSEADDANVQVTVSEVRPDGVEYLVQNVPPAPCPSLRGMACRPYEPRTNLPG